MSSKSPSRGGSPSKARSKSPERSSSPSKGITDMVVKTTSPGFLKENTMKFDKVKKNSKGGVQITAEEIKTAFNLLDVDKTGVVLPVLKKRLGVLFPDFTAKDYRFLMNNKKEITIEDLNELLLDNEITNFDPVHEAFKVFDPTNEGAIDGETLKQSFLAYGFGELSEEEFEILIRAADVDGDGLISLEDFRNMLEITNKAPDKHRIPQPRQTTTVPSTTPTTSTKEG